MNLSVQNNATVIFKSEEVRDAHLDTCTTGNVADEVQDAKNDNFSNKRYWKRGWDMPDSDQEQPVIDGSLGKYINLTSMGNKKSARRYRSTRDLGAIILARICHSRVLGGQLHIYAPAYFFHRYYMSDPWLKLQVEAQALADLVHPRTLNGAISKTLLHLSYLSHYASARTLESNICINKHSCG